MTRNGFGISHNTGSHGVAMGQKHRNSSAVIQIANENEGVSHMPHSAIKHHIRPNDSSVFQIEGIINHNGNNTPGP